MAKLVNAYVIYNGASNTYVDDGTVITLNCERLQAFTPRAVWLQRSLAPGDGTTILYQPTFLVNSTDIAQYGNNLIQGFWVEQDGMGMMVDVANVNTIITACNQCCDSSPAVTLTRFYTGGITSFTNPTEQSYCVTRSDDGSAYAHTKFSTDYISQYTGTARLISNISGVSRYRITSYLGWAPVAQGTDVIIPGTCS